MPVPFGSRRRLLIYVHSAHWVRCHKPFLHFFFRCQRMVIHLPWLTLRERNYYSFSSNLLFPASLCSYPWFVANLEDALVKNLKAFVAFARKRVGDPELAADVVQESLLSALKAQKKPESESDIVSWFYRILRNSIIDVYRRRDAGKRALAEFEAEFPKTISSSDEKAICQCFKRLLPELPSSYRAVLERIDLGDGEISSVASELGTTPNNVTVRLHRARKRMRDELVRMCRVCSKHGCRNCSCHETESKIRLHRAER